MPAVSAAHAETWKETAKAVKSAIKKRGIIFAAFVREIGEESKYGRIYATIHKARPPSGADAEKRVKKIYAWLEKHAK